jgi:phosphatidylglycerol:prolipoprotein diacylglycerol transferase
LQAIIWNIDPVLLSFAGLKIHWYGALFATAILSGFQVMKKIYTVENKPIESLDTLLTYAVIGIILGARLGHCFFYDPSYYFSNPLKILAIWEGGLASHGGGLGLIIAIFFYTKKYKMNFLWLLDRLALSTALFGFFVRVANFINSEILGVATNVSWAVVFQRIDNIPRHPVQLYEAFSYLSIFIILYTYYHKTSNKNYMGSILGMFLVMVFSARFVIEFFKEKQAAYAAENLISTGQMLSIPFFITGIILIILAIKKRKVA